MSPSINCGSPTAVLGTDQLPGHGSEFLWKWIFRKNKFHSKLTKKSHFFLLHLHIDIIQMIHNNIDAFGPVLSLCVVRVGDNKAGCGYWRVWEPAYCPHHTAALTQHQRRPVIVIADVN